MPDAPVTVEDYLAGLPDAVRPAVIAVREAIRAGVPGGEERVRYGMPAVMLDERYAIHYAGWKRHIGIYPVSVLDEPLESEVAPYRAAKDSLRFPYQDELPVDLIRRLATELHRRRRGTRSA